MIEQQSLARGRYLLVKKLGEGGMATVYRAFDQRLQVWRAVKVLLPEYSKKKKILARFESEAQTMALLEHPHVVRVYDVDREGEFAYLVMELVEGGCLVDWVETHGCMPPRMAVDCMIEVCQGIQYAHDRGVIHRDIKPHNVMIDRHGVCKVTDFGIARAGDSDQALTKTGAVMGTWGYMAPEQRSDAKHVDVRADVYALGATLFSLLTDRTPMDLFIADRDRSLLEGVHEVLVPLLLQSTAYDREQRHPTADALAAALLELRDALPEVPADTPPLVLHQPKPMERPDPATFQGTTATLALPDQTGSFPRPEAGAVRVMRADPAMTAAGHGASTTMSPMTMAPDDGAGAFTRPEYPSSAPAAPNRSPLVAVGGAMVVAALLLVASNLGGQPEAPTPTPLAVASPEPVAAASPAASAAASAEPDALISPPPATPKAPPVDPVPVKPAAPAPANPTAPAPKAPDLTEPPPKAPPVEPAAAPAAPPRRPGASPAAPPPPARGCPRACAR